MGIREKLSESPALVSGIVAVIIVLVGVIAYRELYTYPGTPSGDLKAYYSNDDGRTYFADKASRETPFQVDGKDAVLAMVYSCDDNATRFVGYLQRSSANAKAAATPKQPGSQYNTSVQRLSVEVKKVGATKWTPLASGEGVKITQVTCPDSKTRPTPVTP